MAGSSWVGMDKFRTSMERVAAAGEKTARASVVKTGALVVSTAKGNFSGSHKKGQPHVGGDQPNVVTGYLRRSIHMGAVTYSGGYAETTVGVGAVYGRRVERGFHGADSLGRTYDQRAFPFFEPAHLRAHEMYPIIAAAEWNKYIGSLA